ncbi:MAG: hypothetical protein JXA58_00810 [Dehalococcoidia bacterium]|nr:hypothetical protein [Dehalococcoidia bacterium]
MEFFKTIEAVRILVISGLLAFLTSAVLILSCRCVPAKGAIGQLRKAPWLQWLFRRHCVLWIVFVTVLAVHVVFAIGFVGNPF